MTRRFSAGVCPCPHPEGCCHQGSCTAPSSAWVARPGRTAHVPHNESIPQQWRPLPTQVIHPHGPPLSHCLTITRPYKCPPTHPPATPVHPSTCLPMSSPVNPPLSPCPCIPPSGQPSTPLRVHIRSGCSYGVSTSQVVSIFRPGNAQLSIGFPEHCQVSHPPPPPSSWPVSMR